MTRSQTFPLFPKMPHDGDILETRGKLSTSNTRFIKVGGMNESR